LLAQGWRGTKVDVSRQALVLAKAQPGDERVKPFELGAPRFRLANQPASSRWWEGREVCADLFDRTDTMRIYWPRLARSYALESSAGSAEPRLNYAQRQGARSSPLQVADGGSAAPSRCCVADG